MDGENFVSPIRDQAACGSCYSFASMAMIEARLRIASNNTLKVVLSPQDIVSCSEYSQGKIPCYIQGGQDNFVSCGTPCTLQVTSKAYHEIWRD